MLLSVLKKAFQKYFFILRFVFGKVVLCCSWVVGSKIMKFAFMPINIKKFPLRKLELSLNVFFFLDPKLFDDTQGLCS